MSLRHKRIAAVAGVFQTPQGDLRDRSQPEVWWECARGACHDAGLSIGDIEGLIGEGPQGVGIRPGLPAAALGFDLLGEPLRFHANGSIGAGTGGRISTSPRTPSRAASLMSSSW